MAIPVADNPEHVQNLSSISLLKEQGFEGADASLSISLFEYYMIWRDLDESTLFVFPVADERYDRAVMRNDLDVEKEFNWIDWPALLAYHGAEREEWMKLPVSLKIYDIVNYHGVENVFGSRSWEGFTIEGD